MVQPYPLMDSDPTQTHKSSSASKLPIKRKTPPNSFTSSAPYSPAAVRGGCNGDNTSPPPFKFHRIWTETDEIRFLQGLLDCAAENLSFPRDLNVFYSRFSGTMSQPYTKSQLSEKLRRLRKKFRVISARLAKGRECDRSLLSPHDRALYDISKQLWHSDSAATTPFCCSSGEKPKKSSFLPSFPSILGSNQTAIEDSNDNNGSDKVDDEIKLREVNDGMAGEEMADLSGGYCMAKVVLDVFDECLKELRKGIVGEKTSFEERWRIQRFAELDVFSKRMRMVMEQ